MFQGTSARNDLGVLKEKKSLELGKTDNIHPEIVYDNQTAKGWEFKITAATFPRISPERLLRRLEEECNRIIMHEAMISAHHLYNSAGKSLPESVMPEMRLFPGSLTNQVQSLKPSLYIRVISLDSTFNILPQLPNNSLHVSESSVETGYSFHYISPLFYTFG